MDSIKNGDKDVFYIVGYFRHWFLLKVDHETFYVIDTLGNRVQGGGKRAFILKFDECTKIYDVLYSQQ